MAAAYLKNRNFSFVSKAITQQNPLNLDGQFRNMTKIESLHNSSVLWLIDTGLLHLQGQSQINKISLM